MNQVFISGRIYQKPVLRMEEGDVPHLTFSLDVRHRNSAGRVHHEQFAVNAWHNLARKGAQLLAQGQLVTLQRYLTQRAVKIGSTTFMRTEVTLSGFTREAAPSPHKPGEITVSQNRPQMTDMPDMANS